MPAEPRATYRLQLHAGFTFDDAAALAPYLRELGVSHAYCSPCLQAAPGSTHGYDVVDHGAVSDELGGEAGHARMCAAFGQAGLGQLLDVVPNHMAIGSPRNRWWRDVLENGAASRWASYFDVEWDPPEARMRNRVLLPMLGDHFGRVLERRELQVERHGGTFVVRYHEHDWPVAPRSMGRLLAAAAEECGSDELGFVADALSALEIVAGDDLAQLRRRHRHKEVLRGLLARLLGERPEAARAVDAALGRLNADPAALGALLDEQNYRVAFWKTASRDLGYRRFFDVNTLAGLRVEVDRVFIDTHDLVLRWLESGVVDGLRIDHPDGLREPGLYFGRLQSVRPGAWIVVEKILVGDERLPESWPVAGTTGYEFMNRVTGLFVDPAGEAPLTALYAELTGEQRPFPAVLLEGKRRALREALGSDLNRLTELLVQVCEAHPRHRDYTRHDLHEALGALVACFPTYRAYASAATGEVRAEDRGMVEEALRGAAEGAPGVEAELFEFLRDLLLLRLRGPLADEFVMRFQQVTGPAMAKGGEDTAFYRYHRLVALNEVGGDPSRFGVSPEAFHAACAEAQRRWPRGLLATSTHDSKRSEDVRARLALLSEIPGRWAEEARAFVAHNRRHWTGVPPDPNTEYLLYQTLVGAWPIEPERLHAYMEKAVREGKERTSWTAPDRPYEAALHAFVEAILADEEFTSRVAALVRDLLEPARVASIAQAVLKHTCPGVGDLYQGTEVWDLSLVDPDNRRPVDYARRRALLAALRETPVDGLWARADEGAPKLWAIQRALDLRRRRPAPFGSASTYEPLAARGERARHAVAFTRGGEVVVVVPRLVIGLRDAGWGDTTLDLPGGRWTDVMTGAQWPGGPVRLADLLRRFPVAVMQRAG